MKNKKWLSVFVILLISAFVLASCGGNDPKALAKQTLDLTVQLVSNPEKSDGIQPKLDAITGKVEKMSKLKQMTYAVELAQLTLNSKELQAAYKKMSEEYQEAIKTTMEEINSPEYQEALGELNDYLGSSEYQDALKEYQNALEELKNLKF